MSTTRIIQRSPDLGIGIRLQRLPQAVQQAFARPAPQPVQPPWWWGRMDAAGQRATTLTVQWDPAVGPDYPFAYWPGLWVAVVEGATAVRWDVKFTPKIWFKDWGDGAESELVWTGEPIALQLPPALPAAPEALFTPALVTLPDPLAIAESSVDAWTYWAGAYYTPTFPALPAPIVIAAGNTLSVAQDTKSMSGSLVANAFVDDVGVGAVWLDLMREVQKTWS